MVVKPLRGNNHVRPPRPDAVVVHHGQPIGAGTPLPQIKVVRFAINDCTDYNAITFLWLQGVNMASLTIRNLDESLKADLRLRAARHGCSMEEEARQILRQTLARGTPAGSLARRIHGRFAGLDAESLPIPDRKPSRPAPQLE